MKKFFVLLALILGVKAFSQSDSSMRTHVHLAFDMYTADYVLSHTKLETISKEKQLPKQKYMRLRAVYDTATKGYKPVLEDYSIRVGEILRGFKGEYYYSETYKAYLFPVREAKAVEAVDAGDKKKDGTFGKVLLTILERASQRFAQRPYYTSSYGPGGFQQVTPGYVQPVYATQ